MFILTKRKERVVKHNHIEGIIVLVLPGISSLINFGPA